MIAKVFWGQFIAANVFEGLFEKKNHNKRFLNKVFFEGAPPVNG